MWIEANSNQLSLRSSGLSPLIDDISSLAVCAKDDRNTLFVSQRNSSTILKVAVSCNGVVLKATLESFVTIPDKGCCTGLVYNKETKDLIVAVSQNTGGIYFVDTRSENGEAAFIKVIHNRSPMCSRAYGIAVCSTGDIFFTDVDAGKLGRIVGHAAEYVIGSQGDTPRDGCEKTAVLIQPTALCSEGNSFYLADTGSGSLRLISPTNLMANFMKHVRMLYSSHGIHSSISSFSDAIRLMEEAATYFKAAVQAAKRNSGGRKTVQDPHGVPSCRTVGSIQMTLDALRAITRVIENINPTYLKHANPKSLVTLIVEHFNSKMRETSISYRR